MKQHTASAAKMQKSTLNFARETYSGSRSPTSHSQLGGPTRGQAARASKTVVKQTRQRSEIEAEIKQVEQKFSFPADFDQVPALPERYIDDGAIGDFAGLEQAF